MPERFDGEKWVMASRRVWAGISAMVAAVLVALKGFGVELPFGIEEINAAMPSVIAVLSVVLIAWSKWMPDNAILRRVMKAGMSTAPRMLILLACFFWIGCASCDKHDTDGDGIADSVDNCTFDANANQLDEDADGHGTVCDADFNQSKGVDFADSILFKQAQSKPFDPLYDLNGDGAYVNEADYERFQELFGKPPGPSAGQ